MEHGINVIKGGKIIRTSHNLRGMLDYARVSPVVRIYTAPYPDVTGPHAVCGTVYVQYADGATCRANFRSFGVMVDWLRNRRTWRDAVWADRATAEGCLSSPGKLGDA